MDYKRLIGQHIKEARIASGMEQTDIAAAVSVSVTSVSQWENGHTYPKIDKIALIAELTQHDLAWFFTTEGDEKNFEIDENVHILIDTYAKLNSAGRAHFLDYASVLRSSQKYID